MMAGEAPGIAAKQVEPQEFSIGPRRGVAAEEVVESRSPADHGPLKRGQRVDHAREVDRPPRKRLGEELAIVRALREQGHHVIRVRGHLGRIGERLLDLPLQGRRTAIPEEGRLPGGVADGRSVSRRNPMARLAHRAAIGPATRRVVARHAGELAAGRQPGIVEQQPAEGGLRLVGRVRLGMLHER